MVDIETYKQQLELRRKQIEEEKKRVQQIIIPSPTVRELRQPNLRIRGQPASALKQRELLRSKKAKLTEAKQEKLKAIGEEEGKQLQLEQEFAPQYEKYKKEVEEYQKQLRKIKKQKERQEKQDAALKAFSKVLNRGGNVAVFAKGSPYEKRVYEDYMNFQKSSGIQEETLEAPSKEFNLQEIPQETISVEPQQSKVEDTKGWLLKTAEKVFAPSVWLADKTIEGWSKILTPTAIDIKNKVEKPATTFAKFSANVGGTVGKVPTVSPINLVTKGKFELSTLGQEAQKVSEGLSWVSGRTQMGYERISRENLRLDTSKPITKFAIGATGTAPYLLAYGYAPTTTLSTEVLSGGTKYKNVKKESNKIIDEEWKKYQSSTVPEGYEKLSREEWLKQVRPQVEQAVEKEALWEAGTAGAFLVGGAGLKAYRWTKTPVVKEYGLWSGMTKQRAYLQADTEALKVGNVFWAKQERVLEPWIREINTNLGKLFEKPSTRKIISPPRAYVDIATATGEGKDIFIESFKVGKGGAGKSKLAIEKPLVSGEFQGTQATLSNLFSRKGIQSFLTFTKEKVAGASKLLVRDKELPFSFSKIKSVTMDITKRFPKKIPIESQTTNLFTYLGEGAKGGNKIITSGKKSSQEFFQRLYGSIEKIELPKVTIPKPKPILTGVTKPSSSTEKVITSSAYAGTGMYERTTGGQAIGELNLLEKSKDITGVIHAPDLKENLLIKDIQQTTQKVKLVDKPVERITPTVVPRPSYKTITSPVEETSLKQPVLTKLIPAVTQAQTPILKTPNPRRVIPKTPQLTVPRTPTIKIPIPKTTGAILEKTKKKVAQKGLFSVFVRKKGKDIKILEDETLLKAKKVLKKELKSTLAASGFITKSKNNLKKVRVDLGFEFAPSKVDPLRIVQKRGFRLGTRSEVLGIQKERKKKGRKSKWF